VVLHSFSCALPDVHPLRWSARLSVNEALTPFVLFPLTVCCYLCL
jgi:hypothetical protein